MEKDWENRTIEFEQPIDNNQLVQIVHKSMKELKLRVDWNLGYGFIYDGWADRSRPTREKASGYIYDENISEPISEFNVKQHIDNAKGKPAYGSILFSPDWMGEKKENIERYNENIDKIYQAVEKNYREVIAK